MAKSKTKQTIVTVEIRVNYPTELVLKQEELTNQIKITAKNGLKIMGCEFGIKKDN